MTQPIPEYRQIPEIAAWTILVILAGILVVWSDTVPDILTRSWLYPTPVTQFIPPQE